MQYVLAHLQAGVPMSIFGMRLLRPSLLVQPPTFILERLRQAGHCRRAEMSAAHGDISALC